MFNFTDVRSSECDDFNEFFYYDCSEQVSSPTRVVSSPLGSTLGKKSDDDDIRLDKHPSLNFRQKYRSQKGIDLGDMNY